MAWPTTPITTSHLDQGGDSLSDARTDLLSTANAVNAMMAARGLADGIASLDASGKIDPAQYDAEDLLSVLADFDGADSGLDADTLDGKDADDLVWTDGTRLISFDVNATAVDGNPMTVGFQVIANSSETINTMTALAIEHLTSGTPAAGFGVQLDLVCSTAGGTRKTPAAIRATWTDPTSATADGKLVFRVRENGTATNMLAIEHGYAFLFDTTTSGALAGGCRVYSKSGSLYYRNAAGTEVGPLVSSGAGTDHGTLTGLGDDDHTQYVLADGTRSFTGTLLLGGNSIEVTELGADPTTPSTGHWKLYFKSGGLYHRDDAGTVTLVAAPGGGADHGSLTGLADNDHPQYLLRQPAANYVLNDAGSDFDFRIEGVSAANLFYLNAGQANIKINPSLPDGTTKARFEVYGGSLVGIYASTTLTGFGTGAIRADSTGTAGATGLLARADNGPALVAERTLSHDPTATWAVSIVDPNDFAALTCLVDGSDVAGSVNFRVSADGATGFDITPAEVTTHIDLKAKSTSFDPLLFVDFANDRVEVGVDVAGTAMLNVGGGSGGEANGIYADAYGSGQGAVAGEAKGSATFGVKGIIGAGAAGAAYAVWGRSDTAGRAGMFQRSQAGFSGAPVLDVQSLHASDVQPVLQVVTIGTGSLLRGFHSATKRFDWMPTGQLEWLELGATPGTLPPTDAWQLYFKSGGLYMRDDAGAETQISGAGSGGHIIAEEGSNLTARPTLNFIGQALTAADNSGANRTDVSLSMSPSSASVVGTGRTISTTTPLAGGGDLSADRTISILGLSSIGSANNIPGVNAAGNAWEYKALAGASGEISITHGVSSITVGLVTPIGVAKGGTNLASYTKGDLLVASATTTLSKVAVGADNQVLIADSSQATGVRWSSVSFSASDANAYYLDGSRTMTADVKIGQFSLLFDDLSSHPAAPAAGKTKLYAYGGSIWKRTNGGAPEEIGSGSGGSGSGFPITSSAGAIMDVVTLESLVTLSGAFTNGPALIAGDRILAMRCRVATTATGSGLTGIDVGIGPNPAYEDQTCFAKAMGILSGSTNNPAGGLAKESHQSTILVNADGNIKFRPVGAATFTGGTVRCTVWVMRFTAPTS